MKFPSPSITPPVLSNWQHSYLGLTFGVNAGGIGIVGIDGLDMAQLRSADMTRARSQGELTGLDLYPGRDITYDLFLNADSADTFIQNQVNLATVTQSQGSTEQPLWFQLPGMEILCVMARPRARTMAWDFNYSAANIGSPTIMFHATSPFIWGQGQSASVGVSPTIGSLTFPATFPLTFGSTSPNTMVATNAGNVTMSPVLVLTGPMTNPTIANISISGSPYITVSNPTQTGYTILSGDQMTIDLDTHDVLYYSGGMAHGTPAARPSWIVSGSTWWTLPPGSNTIQLSTQDSAATAGSAAIWWADAWLI